MDVWQGGEEGHGCSFRIAKAILLCVKSIGKRYEILMCAAVAGIYYVWSNDILQK